MANKRRLKKNIHAICSDIATECAITATYIQGCDEKRLSEAIVKTAALQADSMERLSVSFEHTPSDYDNKAEYNKARRAYYRKAYKAFGESFQKEVTEILHELNSSLPKKA